MPFVKGTPKPEGSGRKKGTINKRTKEVLEILKDHDFNPLEQLLIKYDKFDNAKDGDLIAIGILKDILPYVYPRRTSNEHSGVDGSSIEINRPLEDVSDEELLQLVPEATKMLLEKNK